MQAAVDKGPHVLVLVPKAFKTLPIETLQRVVEGLYHCVLWNDIILDLSYKLRVNDTILQSFIGVSDKMLAPQHAMYKLGNVISNIIFWQTALAGAFWPNPLQYSLK